MFKKYFQILLILLTLSLAACNSDSGSGGEGIDSGVTDGPGSGETEVPDSGISTTYTGTENIILGRPTDSSIAVSVQAEDVSGIQIRYGLESGDYAFESGIYESTTQYPVFVNINGLEKDKEYFYIFTVNF